MRDKKDYVEVGAMLILNGLMANPERYKYIAAKVEAGELTNEQATAKNVNKAIVMAEAMYDEIEKRYGKEAGR